MFRVTIWFLETVVTCVDRPTQQAAQDEIDFWVGHSVAYWKRGKAGFDWQLVFHPEAA